MLFRNDDANVLSASYYAAMKVYKDEDSDLGVEVREYTILYVARIDVWVMAVLKCVLSEQVRKRKRQKEVCGLVSIVFTNSNGADN